MSPKPARKAAKPAKKKASRKATAQKERKKDAVEAPAINEELLRRTLSSKRQQLLKQAQDEVSKYIRGESRQLVETALDDGDWSVIDVVEDVILRKLSAHRENIVKIDEALRKLDNNTYGVCEECGDEINPERLRIMPFAIYCRDCQEEKEKLEEASRAETPFQ